VDLLVVSYYIVGLRRFV